MKHLLPKIFNPQNIVIVFLLLLLCCVPFALNTYKTNAPVVKTLTADPIEQDHLNKLISESKYETESTIETLLQTTYKSELVEYRKKYVLGRLLENKKDYVQALDQYKPLLEQNGILQERVLLHYADANIEIGDDKTALKYYNKLIKDFPSSKTVPQARYRLAQTLSRLRYDAQAIKAFKSLRDEFPLTNFGIASNYYLGEDEYNKKNFGHAQKYWREYLKNSPSGRFSTDIVKYLTKNENFALEKEDYSLIGSVFFELKDYANASKYLSIGNDESKYYELGFSLFRSMQCDPAKDAFIKYAKKADPKDVKTRYALFYSAICIPDSKKKNFWASIKKTIPALEYYAMYKEASSETNSRKKRNLLEDLIEKYPDSPFTFDAVWDLMWEEIKEKKYTDAFILGERQFNLSRDKANKTSDTRIKVGFWLGKLSEYLGQPEKAKTFYEESGSLSFDDYYAHRSRYKLNLLTTGVGENSKHWKLKYTPYDLNNFRWEIPSISSAETLNEYFGEVVSELFNLQQYDEAIDLIGKEKTPSKKITTWLKALNEKYMESINDSYAITTQDNLPSSDPLYKLSYPIYYWAYILAHSKNYPNFDPLLAAGIIRQESRYEKKAISVSEARGLMQLIPSTARMVAKQLNISLDSLDTLYEPKINTALGIFYLQNAVKMFDNPLFAVAGYNAGPGASQRWIGKFGTSDLDLFVEQIPYSETRDYVKKVFGGYWTYQALYGPKK